MCKPCGRGFRLKRVVALGHQRCDIENRGFNDLANEWVADHVYRHEPAAMEAFLLTALLAFNLYHAFIRLNLKPPLFLYQLARSRWQIDAQAFQTLTVDCHFKRAAAHHDSALVVWTMIRLLAYTLLEPLPGHFFVTRLTEAERELSPCHGRPPVPRTVWCSLPVHGRVFKGPCG